MDDRQFWDNHYVKFGDKAPSAFCVYCIDKVLEKSDVLIELGCGNGRDGLELGRVVNKYVGLDSCSKAIGVFREAIDQGSHKLENVSLKAEDFTRFDFSGIAGERVAIYSRFSLHSIDYASQARLLDNLELIDTSSWICMIEARTIRDELYGVGTPIGKHEFVTDHYRRFIDPREFLSTILGRFDVRYFEVSNSFAMYKGDDPTVMRVVFGRTRSFD